MEKILEYFKEAAREKQLCSVHFISGVLYLEHLGNTFILANEAKLSDRSIAKLVISYLNERSGKSFKEVESNIKPIVARMREGFVLQDFYSVIDVKLETWAKDPSMRAYIRPVTLFGTKMDSYLQEAKNKVRGQKDLIDEIFTQGIEREKYDF